MEGNHGLVGHASASRRTCARRGCANPVKKPTAKYCSVGCCAVDPERHERLRVQARRTGRRNILPLARQLRFEIAIPTDAEAPLEHLAEDREDIPRGMSRLTAV